jgi:hypothetical protein
MLLRSLLPPGVAEFDIVTPAVDVKHIGFHATGLRVHAVTVDGAAARRSVFSAFAFASL